MTATQEVGQVTCSADATRLRDGQVSVTAVVADDHRRLFGPGTRPLSLRDVRGQRALGSRVVER